MPFLIFLLFLLIFGGAGILVFSASGGNQKREMNARLQAAIRDAGLPQAAEAIDIRKNSALSAIPWLNRLLKGLRPTGDLRLLLEQASLQWTPGRLVLMSGTLWLIGSTLLNWRLHLGLFCLLASIPLGAAPLLYVLVQRQKRFARFEQALPDSLDLMASALRGGHSMISALGIVGNEAPEPVGRELRLCFEEQNFGLDLRTALENLVTRVPLQDLRIVATAMVIQKESGGNLAEVVEKTAGLIRERFRLKQQIRVHTAQGRLTGWILSALPCALGCITSFLNPSHIGLLLHSPLGQKMIWTGLTMNLVGLLVIQKIIRIRV